MEVGQQGWTNAEGGLYGMPETTAEPTRDVVGIVGENIDESSSPLDSPSHVSVQSPETSEKPCAWLLLGIQSGVNLA